MRVYVVVYKHEFPASPTESAVCSIHKTLKKAITAMDTEATFKKNSIEGLFAPNQAPFQRDYTFMNENSIHMGWEDMSGATTWSWTIEHHTVQ